MHSGLLWTKLRFLSSKELRNLHTYLSVWMAFSEPNPSGYKPQKRLNPEISPVLMRKAAVYFIFTQSFISHYQCHLVWLSSQLILENFHSSLPPPAFLLLLFHLLDDDDYDDKRPGYKPGASHYATPLFYHVSQASRALERLAVQTSIWDCNPVDFWSN